MLNLRQLNAATTTDNLAKNLANGEGLQTVFCWGGTKFEVTPPGGRRINWGPEHCRCPEIISAYMHAR